MNKYTKESQPIAPLTQQRFVLLHLSYLINLNYIKRYIKGDGGQIEMENGQYVDVSRRKKDEFIKLIRP